MITVCWQLLLLPWTSTTVQVTVLVPTGKLAGALLVTLATPQLSAVAGVPRVTPAALHSPMLAFAVTVPGQVMLGASVSSTVTDWVQVLLLPLRSVTVQVTSVVPTGKLVGALLVTLATAQLSDVTGSPSATPLAKHWPALALVVTVAGQAIVGT